MRIKVKLPKAPKPPARLVARLLVWAGCAVMSVGVALVSLPAGVIVAGMFIAGLALLLVDVTP